MGVLNPSASILEAKHFWKSTWQFLDWGYTTSGVDLWILWLWWDSIQGWKHRFCELGWMPGLGDGFCWPLPPKPPFNDASKVDNYLKPSCFSGNKHLSNSKDLTKIGLSILSSRTSAKISSCTGWTQPRPIRYANKATNKKVQSKKMISYGFIVKIVCSFLLLPKTTKQNAYSCDWKTISLLVAHAVLYDPDFIKTGQHGSWWSKSQGPSFSEMRNFFTFHNTQRVHGDIVK